MANAEEKFRMEILAEFNKSGLLKEFKDLTNRIDGAAADKLKQTMNDMGKSGMSSGNMGSGGLINDLMEEIRNTNDAIKETNSVEELAELNRHQANLEKQLKDLKNLGMQSEDANNESVGFFRSAMRGMRGVMGLLTKVAAAVGLISSIWQVVEPAIKMLQTISDMLAMFLRPITDIFITLLTPIMVMLRPMLQVFNTLMMPFRQLAMEGLGASNQLIGEGMNEILTGDADLGRGMVSEGLKGALSSAQLMMSGLLNVIMSPLTKIPGIGNAIQKGLDQAESDAIKGVLTVIGIGNEVNQYLEGAMDSEIFGTITNGVRGIVSGVENEFGQFSIDDVEIYKDEVSKRSDELFSDMREAANYAYSITSVLNDLQGSSYENLAEKTTEARMAVDELSRAMNEVNNKSKQVDDRGVFQSIWDGIKSGIGNPWKSLDELNGAEMVGRSITSPLTAGMYDILRLTMDFMGNSTIPDGFESGFEHMLNTTNDYMGNENSRITTTFNRGMISMSSNTDKFGGTLKTVTGLLDDATKRMEGYARSYANAVRRIQRLESSLRNARSVVR